MGVRDSHLRLINDELVLDEVLKISDNAVKETPENAFEAAAAADSEITPPEQFQNSFHQNEQTGKRKKKARKGLLISFLRNCIPQCSNM